MDIMTIVASTNPFSCHNNLIPAVYIDKSSGRDATTVGRDPTGAGKDAPEGERKTLKVC